MGSLWWRSKQEKDAELIQKTFKKKNDLDKGLIMAASNGAHDTVGSLLDRGADVNTALMESGKTPLMIAAGMGYAGVVKLLLAKGADVNARDINKTTALTHAVDNNKNDNYDIVRILLDKGANVSMKNKVGKSPLMYAAKCGDTATVKALLDLGADVNAKDKDGVTALILAAFQRHTDIVQVLLDRGADMELKTNNGLTASGAAEINGHIEVVKLLKQTNASYAEAIYRELEF